MRNVLCPESRVDQVHVVFAIGMDSDTFRAISGGGIQYPGRVSGESGKRICVCICEARTGEPKNNIVRRMTFRITF